MLFSIRELQYVIVKAVGIVPKGHSANAEIVQGAGDVNEMLEELAGDVFISRIFFGQLQSDCQHIEAVHAHPTGPVRLFEMAPGGERRRAVKDSDVVQAQEPSLKDIRAVGVLAVHPPCEIQEQLVKDLFEETTIGHAAHAPLDFVDTPRGPGVNRRVDVAEGPFVRGQLAVGVHVPFAQKEDELIFGKIRIDECQGNAVKRQVPCRVPRILPLIRHGHNVVVVEIRPILVAAVPAL